MKNAYRITLPLLAAILSAGACTVAEENFIVDNGNRDAVEITVNCPANDAEPTRTDITGLNPVWKAGDEIWLSDGINAVSAVVPKEYDGKSYAKVTAVGLDPDADYYALYPYQDSAYVKGNIIYARIPTVQDGKFSGAHLAVGVCKAGSDRNIEFRNASSVLKFSTFREDLAMIQLQNISLDFSGEFKINAETGAKSGNSNSLRKVTIPISSSVIGEKYIGVMECNLPKNSKLTFITSDGRMGYIYTSTRNALSNGYIYDLGNIDDAITMDSEPAVNLGAGETANCYIVNGGGSYRFPAVEGNSGSKISDIAYGDVVWETANKTAAPGKFSLAAEVAYSNGYMYVRIPEDAPDGNFLVSACDQYGNILWSWHIWLLKEGVTDQTWPSGSVMMDRNLGALSALPGNALSNGLLYQWGRKDPFPGLASYSSATAAGVAGSTITSIGSSDETGTLEYATAHPNAFIYKSSGDWAGDDLSFWSARLKTKYDPCPAGYHVPAESAYDGLTADNTVDQSGKYGRLLSHNSQEIWFPYAGWKASASGSLGSTSNSHLYMFYDQNTSASGKCSFAGTPTSFAIGESVSPHASGFSLRCQKIVSSGDVKTVKMKYAVEDITYGVLAPSFTGDAYGARQINWGDGETENLALESYVYHYYNAPATYSITVSTVDATSIIIPVGDLVELDITGF